MKPSAYKSFNSFDSLNSFILIGKKRLIHEKKDKSKLFNQMNLNSPIEINDLNDPNELKDYRGRLRSVFYLSQFFTVGEACLEGFLKAFSLRNVFCLSSQHMRDLK